MDRALDLGGARVLILGWAGSTERQLRTVVRWYRERNGQPMTACAHVYEAMRRPDGWAREAERIAARLRGGRGPLIVHAFSNAGFWMYAATLEALEAAQREAICAVVLDSAPGFPPRVSPRFYARSSSMAMMPLLLRMLGRRPATRHPLLTPPLWLFMRIWYHLSAESRRAMQRSLGVVRETGDWPLAFLYSDADELVEARYVEAFLRTLGEREVTAHRWPDSGHVRHMIQHRDEYFDRVATFLSAAADPPAG